MRTLSIAATGMMAQQTNVEVISNNIANMNTTAYNRRRPEFTDLLYQNIQRIGTTSSDMGTIVPSGIQLGLGVKTTAVYRITEPGSLQNTNNTLDLAVQGRGYFKVLLPSGEYAYTRDGTFQLSPTGQIVTQQGYQVMPGISIDNNATGVTIDTTGQVNENLSGQITPAIKGQFTITIFPNDAGLEATGDNLFLATPASGNPLDATPGKPGYGTILQGYLETSNVNVVSEVTDLISAQRAYEMNSKVIQAADEMLNTVNQLK
ncbi:MAG: flagellar basal-body rod protein FlgG [Magnetospirillum sp.]|nr:flagellar basal-body rod protein FlgG [Magnetospirillum sp.]